MGSNPIPRIAELGPESPRMSVWSIGGKCGRWDIPWTTLKWSGRYTARSACSAPTSDPSWAGPAKPSPVESPTKSGKAATSTGSPTPAITESSSNSAPDFAALLNSNSNLLLLHPSRISVNRMRKRGSGRSYHGRRSWSLPSSILRAKNDLTLSVKHASLESKEMP